MQYFLGKRGAQLLTVRDGKEAVEAFRRSEEGSIDLILMDIMMPVMDGLEATRLIRDMERADAAAVPILAMTANAFAEDVKNTKEAGMNEHLSKPLNMPKVMQCMNRYLKK
ncbi:response regulator [Oscillospiraceae bacterium NTUH-002-81]|nr:response regulator [Oscillospiraceae bacterium NTUH-002-81]